MIAILRIGHVRRVRAPLMTGEGVEGLLATGGGIMPLDNVFKIPICASALYGSENKSGTFAGF